MKLYYFIIFQCTFCFSAMSQTSILYDLDTYQRVTGEYRTTFISPTISISYDTIINLPSFGKNVNYYIGGDYDDFQIYNDENYQITKQTNVELDLNFGTVKRGNFLYIHDSDTRSYDDLQYFKHGFYFKTANNYSNQFGIQTIYNQDMEISYDLGFGFGRLEVINNAWLGARILEELQKKGLLLKRPSVEEMKPFFDLIGDLDLERVMDFRLRSIYQIEQIIKFVEQKSWIEQGSIPAFVTISDAFRFEDFFIRQSGERLEFTLTPTILGLLDYDFTFRNLITRDIQLGFLGNTEYQIHKNGDLAYYDVKILGGNLGYFERFRDREFRNDNIILGEVYFEYQYNYLPSLRTNLRFVSNTSGRVIYDDNYSATLVLNASAEYAYYFSPATRLSINAAITYNDRAFQIGDYQPQIRFNFFARVIHALR